MDQPSIWCPGCQMWEAAEDGAGAVDAFGVQAARCAKLLKGGAGAVDESGAQAADEGGC